MLSEVGGPVLPGLFASPSPYVLVALHGFQSMSLTQAHPFPMPAQVSSLCWLLDTNSAVGVDARDHQDYSKLPLDRIKDHPNFVLIPPAPSHLVIGDIKTFADKANVKPETIIGYWFGRTPEDEVVKPEEVVVMNMHGGAYIMCSAHPSDITAILPKELLAYGNKSGTIDRILSIDYRLSSMHPFKPNGQFPSAVLDALSGYIYLISLGFRPQNIIFSGDSAGGNLVLAITRYLVEANHPDLPVPGGLLLTSPWSDMSLQHNRPGGTSETNYESDYFSSFLNVEYYALMAFIGVHDPHEYLYNPYISPASPFLPHGLKVFDQRWPRTMIIAGGGEMMLDEIKSLSHAMLEGGVDVTWCEMEDAVHDFFCCTFFEEHSRKGLEAVVEWLKARMVRTPHE
jgi:acetyl esterase/lipase